MIENYIKELVNDKVEKIIPNIIESLSTKISAQEESPKYLTRKQAAIFLNVCTSTIDNLVKTGRLKKYKIGKSTRILKNDLLSIVK